MDSKLTIISQLTMPVVFITPMCEVIIKSSRARFTFQCKAGLISSSNSFCPNIPQHMPVIFIPFYSVLPNDRYIKDTTLSCHYRQYLVSFWNFLVKLVFILCFSEFTYYELCFLGNERTILNKYIIVCPADSTNTRYLHNQPNIYLEKFHVDSKQFNLMVRAPHR